MRRPNVRQTLWRGARRLCPHCGRGPVFVRWMTMHDRCNVCGLQFLPNQGDTWLYWIVMDRISLAVGLVLIVFFGLHVTTWQMGRAVVDELRHAGRQVVVVDSRVSRMQGLAERGWATVTGDATLEATLLAANVQNARGLVSCLNDDAHNVYTVLTARTLSADLFIVARATEEGAERRILQAGANRVVNPYHLGGARLAHLVVKPAIVNFFDASVDGSDLQLDQTSLGTDSVVVGLTLAEANMRQRWHLGVVAMQRGTEVVASPSADFRLQAGDVLVVFGSHRQIQKFDEECG